MSIYVQSLFYAIPIFMVLIIIEAITAQLKGTPVNHSADMISSLSSGVTNTIRDGLKFGFAIISYSWLVDHITIYRLEPVWLAVIIAFIVQDFTGYWIHRLNHRVNILWNRHIIHHSSEEFNLSCALRQSISDTIRFSAIFMIPAALLGIPLSIFAIIGPIQLFMQFWYHTRLIDKMGWLEYILVTPSHHRVHHAINSEYIDKNYSQIFIIWDKIFGSFQLEMKDVPPVYGILRPARTWNPVIINFKHLWQLMKDAWYTQRLMDKLIIWFMPTGWRPNDVAEKYPLEIINDPYNQKKYQTGNSPLLLAWSWIQLTLALLFMFHLFIIMRNFPIQMVYIYAIFIILHVFAYTTTLDGRKSAIIIELAKLIMGILLLTVQEFNWYGSGGIMSGGIISYLIISQVFTYYFLKEKKSLSSISQPVSFK